MPFTRLEGKEHSPLILRRYSTPVLHWVCLITDDNLDRLDEYVTDAWDLAEEDKPTTIQEFRNMAGDLCTYLSVQFKRAEGIAVIVAADKMLISSLYGDFMNHAQCRLELYSLLQLSTQV